MRRIGWIVPPRFCWRYAAKRVCERAASPSKTAGSLVRSNAGCQRRSPRSKTAARRPTSWICSFAQLTPADFAWRSWANEAALSGGQGKWVSRPIAAHRAGTRDLAAGSIAAVVDPLGRRCWPQRLARPAADLVLAVVSVCENLTHEPASAMLVRLAAVRAGALVVGDSLAAHDGGLASPRQRPSDFESYLRALAPQLAACRTPIDDAMRARWQRTFSALDDVVADCRERRIPVAPGAGAGRVSGESHPVRDARASRCGYSAEQIDVELAAAQPGGVCRASPGCR